MLGKTVHEILPKEQADYIVAKTREAILTGRVTTAEYALQIGGKEIWFSCNVTRLSEDTALWVAHDFSERKQADEALEKSEKRFRTLIEEAPIAILISRNGIIEYANQRDLKLFGEQDGKDVVGRPTIEFLAPQTREASLERTHHGPLGLSVPSEFEDFGLRSDGSQFPVHVAVKNLDLRDGNANISFITDITERRAAEEAIHKAGLYNRSLIEANLDPLVTIGPDGKITDVNASTETATGLKRNELIGTDFSDYFTEPEKARRGYEQVFKDELVRNYPLELKHSDGRVIQVSYNATVYYDEQGSVIGVFAAARDISERKQAEQAIHQHVAELEMLHQSGLALGQLLTPKEIAQKLIGLMSSKLNWHHTAIRLYHPEDDSLELLAFNKPGASTTAELREAERRLKSMISKAGDGLSGWAVQQRQNLRIGELSNDPRFVKCRLRNIHSGMYIPLKVEDRVVGVISIESEKPEAFSEADERLTITLANQAAIALENARLHQETLHQLKQLQALHTIDRTIAGSFDQGMMLDVLLIQTLSQLEAEAAAIFLIQPHQRGALQYVAGQGFNTGLIQIASLKLGNSLAGEAVTRRELIHVREPEQGEPDPLLSKLWLEEGIKSMHVIPLISKGEVKGVMTVFHRKAFTPNPAWSSFLETLAGQAAIAIDVTQMFDNLQRANMELAVAYEATIEGWSQAMDLRDKETEGHTQRVTQMSMQLGKAMQLGEEYLASHAARRPAARYRQTGCALITSCSNRTS